jgi:predicted small metal-binding protein
MFQISLNSMPDMTKTISCNFTGHDCSWSAESTRNDDEELISLIKEHVLATHKQVELNPENIENIKSLIKVTKRFWWWG